MKLKEFTALTFFIVMSACATASPPNTATAPAENQLVKERLSVAMTNLQESGQIYLDKSVPGGTKYILLDKDELSSGMDWLGYSLIEGIDGKGAYNIVTRYFLKQGSQPGLTVRLLNEPPEFSWSLKNGANLSADISKFFSASVKVDDSYIYEFTISKVADFTVDKQAFDDSSFNSSIFALYMFSDGLVKPTLTGYENFKKTYGVARGGSLYEVILNEYKSTTIDGDADISGLVKAKGGFYKKTGGSVKKTIFKLFYANAGPVDPDKFSDAISKFKPIVDRVQNKDAVTAAIKSSKPLGGENAIILKNANIAIGTRF